MVFQNNGVDNLTANSNETFTFATSLSDDSNFDVSVLTQPTSPNQTCAVSNPIGIISGSDVIVNVICSTNTYLVGGHVSGLFHNSSVVLQNNLQDNTTITCNGPFVFNTPLDDLSDYAATILSQPQSPLGNCVLSQANGAITGDDVISIQLSCEYTTTGDYLFKNGFDGSPFYNMVVGFQTEQNLEQLSKTLRDIEFRFGRELNAKKFSPRTLDLDILLYGDLIQTEPVQLPRDEITFNAFVLWPLAEIAPQQVHPVLKETYQSLWQKFDKTTQQLKIIPFNWQG